MAAAQRLGHGRVHLIEIRHQFHTKVTHVEATKRGVPNGASLCLSSPSPLPERMTWRHLHTAPGVGVPLPEATSEPPNHSKIATVAYALVSIRWRGGAKRAIWCTAPGVPPWDVNIHVALQLFVLLHSWHTLINFTSSDWSEAPSVFHSGVLWCADASLCRKQYKPSITQPRPPNKEVQFA